MLSTTLAIQCHLKKDSKKVRGSPISSSKKLLFKSGDYLAHSVGFVRRKVRLQPLLSVNAVDTSIITLNFLAFMPCTH
jgi:hypothetical protein